MSRAWWRRNRPWLLVLPVALALLALATSSRYFDIWRHQSFHQRLAEVGVGEQASVDLSDDGEGDGRFRVQVTDVEERDTVPADYGDPEPLPQGQTGWTVTLEFEGAVQDDVGDCNVVLVDAEGSRYGDERVDPWDQFLLCEPADEDLDEAAQEWTATPFVAAPEGVEITEVWLTWGLAQESYVAVRVD